MNTEECTQILSKCLPIRQGDILYFPNNPDNHKYGIIITGDCDITQNKCRRLISYCLLTTAKYYFESEVLKDEIFNKAFFKLHDIIEKNVCKLLGAQSSESFFETLLEQDTNDLHEILKNDELVSQISYYKNNVNNEVFSLSNYKEVLQLIDQRISSNDLERKINDVLNKFSSKICKMPGDKYFINELPTQDDIYGFVVHLRLINTISQDDIEKQLNLYRIAHLEAPFLYKLTQRLGAVFSDIGEPETFEKHRTDISKLLCEEINK